ncbi:hypothetical protein TCAL_08975 [Tigriopus californicus]|uniref:Uncharacterized protein n=1 Tax=Tigriopus californicus TaxID=6832 RepID=A0A553PMD5_TIGCA|nr:uncharacterized protein LOC131890240 [Tigriopus californicus]TRY78844.1 hypothetical protein TCAL_08975 [Tigriopus californicus]|eukprot:TCALIF_08975-PA protein Name:"Protein of unknown function" AED:0.00 eAED:0.00 QI:72/1/1/1/1/1/2/11/182
MSVRAFECFSPCKHTCMHAGIARFLTQSKRGRIADRCSSHLGPINKSGAETDSINKSTSRIYWTTTNLFSKSIMKFVLILTFLMGVALASSQEDDPSQIMEAPEYNTLTQDKIIELYEFLKDELEGEDMEADLEKEVLRNRRSAEASPFFLRWLFGRRDYDYGYDNHHNRGYRSHGRRNYFH